MAPVHFSRHKMKTNSQRLLVTIRSGSIAFVLMQYSDKEDVKPIILFENVVQLHIEKGSDAPAFICKTESVLEIEVEKFISAAAKYFAEQEL